MSYMSLFEKNVEYSNAISILNEYRHYLKDSHRYKFTNNDKEILLESLKLNNRNRFHELVFYNLRLFADVEKSAAIELSNAINNSLNKKFKDDERRKEYFEYIRNSLKPKSSLENSKKGVIEDLIIESIKFISNQSKKRDRIKSFEKIGL